MEQLHEHNQRTYENICRMYDEGIQRVAVVQPTGSGKSLLMTKLIEDNPNSRFFVLSTRHEINDQFKEKLNEGMLKRSDFNIYCNMPNMKLEVMEALQPDYILLDEMHRALAKEWSKGIKVLLEMYPNAKVLGLSATPIRYLDRCRNVVEELFDGNLAWGNVHDIIKEDIQVIFTASQLKMWKYYNSWEDYKKAFHENGMRISINKFADTEPKGYVKTSYQFIQTLSSEKLTDEKLAELCADTIEYLNKMKTDLDTMIKIVSKENDYILALEQYKELVYDEYIQSKLESKFKSERNDARGNKLILKDSLYSYICPDLYAFCTWLFCGIENPKGIIPQKCVYNSFYNDKSYEVVDCLRSPHLYVEHGIRQLVKDDVLEKCKEWFNDYDTIVSSHDLLCRLLMFDVDGDEILLTPNKTIIECVPDDIVPLYYVPFEPVKSEINNDTIYQAIVSCMENTQIGDISNVMTKNYNNADTDMEFNKIMCCYNNLSIDYPKTQNIVKLGQYEEKYNALKGESNPYFFR